MIRGAYFQRQKTRRVVLTGGPCAGKTACLLQLARRFPGRVAVVPEASTLLLNSGLPNPGESPANLLPGQWRKLFQSKLVALQHELEAQFHELAEHSGCPLVLCDRGVLDGAAYWPDGRENYLATHNLTLEQAMGRYETVICLESLAVGYPELYGKHGNPSRLEGPELARQVDALIRIAWTGHPRLVQIPSHPSFDGLLYQVTGVVEGLLA